MYVFSRFVLFCLRCRTILGSVLTSFVGVPQAEYLPESPATVPPDPQYFDAEPSHRDRLKREAEGLFAGVTLLNEIEPLEDIDEPNVAQSHDERPSNNTQLINDFLYQLQPAYSSEGIFCQRCDLYPFCSRPFPCTSRDILQHFKHCQFLPTPGDAEEHFHEALEAFLEQPESKTHITNLQQKGRKIQEKIQNGLRSLPDIDDFLCNLNYLPSGKVKCQRPACANLDGFKPDYSSYKTHFILHHCANFEGALQVKTIFEIESSIKSQLKRPKTASIMANIREHARFGIPIEQRISDLTHPQLKYPSEIRNSNTAHSLEIKKPSWEQLRVLRTLRAKFIVNHRQFLQRTASSCSDKLQDLRKSCRRYADLLDTGLLTFKAIMNNECPSSLKEIFAFISLSYAMVGTMQAKGKPVDFCLDRKEMTRWRSSLRNEDLDTFDELVPLLWPELDTYQDEYPHYWYLFPINLVDAPLRYTAERLLGESSADESFCFDDWLGIPNTDTSLFQPRNFDSVASPHDTSWMRSPEMQPPLDSNSRHRNPSSPSEMQHTDSDGVGTTLEQSQCLAQTVLFVQAISFLICEISRTSYYLLLDLTCETLI
jgi:hypothetical protein